MIKDLKDCDNVLHFRGSEIPHHWDKRISGIGITWIMHPGGISTDLGKVLLMPKLRGIYLSSLSDMHSNA